MCSGSVREFSVVRRSLADNGNPEPEFRAAAGFVAVALRRRAATSEPTVVTFFNDKGGVGKTSLAYHLAWMLADLGHQVLAADLDPQANLTSSFLDEDELEKIWLEGVNRATVWSALRPFQEGEGNLAPATLIPTAEPRLGATCGRPRPRFVRR